MITALEWEIIALSLKVALVAIAMVLPIAYALAWLLARREFPGKVLVDALVHLPLVMPPVVTGWLLLMLMGRNGLLGGWLAEHFGIVFIFRWTGAALAAAVMALPLMVRAMRLSIAASDRRLEQAAHVMGAGRLRCFLSISLPLSMPGVIAGVLLGFARSLGEFGATITFVSNITGQTRTLPLAIYSAMQMPGGEAMVMRLALISLLISLLALIASQLLTRRFERAFHS